MAKHQREASQTRLPRVVLAVPDEDWGKELADALHRAGYVPHRTSSPEITSLAVAYRDPAAVILDASLVRAAGFRFMDSIRMTAPGAPVIVVTDASEEQFRLRCLMLGAEDCLSRPFAPQEAILRVRRAVERRQAWRHLNKEKEKADERASRFRGDLGVLRTQLRTNITMLQRAVDFHQRLEPRFDHKVMQTSFLRHLSHQIGVDRLAYLAPLHPGSSWMVTRVHWGLPKRLADQIRVHSAGELATLLTSTGAPLVVGRMGGFPALRLELGILATGGFSACVPLLHKGELFGAVLLGEAKEGGPPSEEMLRLTHFLASALVPALATQDRWVTDRRVSVETLGYLITHLEARDPYLHGHGFGVARLAETIGETLGLDSEELSHLNSGALLHDIGRFEIDAALWSKKGPLGEDDWKLVYTHPPEGERILAEASWPGAVLETVRHHHEAWDGSGYPEKLRAEEIPMLARIVAVADSLDALTSQRPHRSALTRKDALEQIQRDANIKYDPDVVDAACRSFINKVTA